MKKFLFSIVAMLTALTSGASAEDGITLTCDSIVLRGNNIAELTQNIGIHLSNYTDADISTRLYLLVNNHTDGIRTVCVDTLVDIQAHFHRIFDLYRPLPEGDLTLTLATDAEGTQTLGTVSVSIEPFRKLNLSASFSLDMLNERNGENVLYGSHIRGWVLVQNHDIDYYSDHSGTLDEGIMLLLEDSDTGERLFTQHVAYMLWATDKSEINFCYDSMFRDGARYALKAAYSTAHGLEVFDSLCFTTISGTNMYWTADGAVIPLPEGDNRQLLSTCAASICSTPCSPSTHRRPTPTASSTSTCSTTCPQG